jgi:hypothetical protein
VKKTCNGQPALVVTAYRPDPRIMGPDMADMPAARSFAVSRRERTT